MSTTYQGIYPILYAYYERNGQLDRAAMRRQVQCCLAAGAHGIAVLGLITEVGKLSVAERISVIEWAAEDVAGSVPIAATIAGETVEAQIELSRQAEALGASWLILQPPQTTKPGERELMQFFGRVMDSTTLPVGIQNFPEVLGVGLTPTAVGELNQQHPNFTVMKGEGPVYQIRKYMDAANGAVSIFNGRGGIELPDNLRAGCAGIIPAPDCADVQVAMYNAFVAGDLAQLDRLYTATLPYVTFVMQSIEFALTYGKRMTARRMQIDGEHNPRPPLVDADAFGLERLDGHTALLRSYGEWTLD